MSIKKIKVAILFGGKSTEHEVSIQSAKNVFQSLDKKKYDVSLIGIDKKGVWHGLEQQYLLNANFAKSNLPMNGKKTPGVTNIKQSTLLLNDISKFDVVFPVLHGSYGEDGSMQGLLKIADIPFVGSGVLGSAIGMDKDVMKRLLRESGLPVARFKVFKHFEKIDFDSLVKELGLPFFIKPANLGSSIGVSKVSKEDEFEKAITVAFSYDSKILVEEYIKCREIECSVFGNTNPIVSLPGEIIPTHEYYSYEAKYLDTIGAKLEIPAKLPVELIEEIQTLAINAFSVLCLEGMARVDFFLTPQNKVYINEVNTIPGFTSISMYPKLWEASGISYSELVDRLIQLALERFHQAKSLKTTI